jgi:hypothetical protein
LIDDFIVREETKMTIDLLDQLKEIDRAILTEVVRKDQHNPDLVLLDWLIEPLSHEKIIDTTGGLFCFSGQCQGEQGIQPWKVVMKCINNPVQWAQEPRGWAYWKRECLAFQSGILERLPPGIRAPRYYGVMENENEAGVCIWIEHIRETTGKHWSVDYFQRTARQLGIAQAYLQKNPLSDQPWFSQYFFRNVWVVDNFWSGFMNPASEENAWKSPIVQRGFDDHHKARLLQLLAEKERFFDVNERLPQVLCHFDASRRNFMWSRSRQTGEEELVGVDWAFTGIGGLGNDLGQLIGTSLYFFEYSPSDAETLEAAVFDGYLAGLAEKSVAVDARLVRLGYLISLSFWMGAMLPGWAAFMLPSDSNVNVQAMFGHSAEDILAGWVQLDSFCLDRADEARALIRQLGL